MSLRTLWSRWLPLRRRLDRLGWPLGAIGLVVVAAYNWRQWQRDKELLARVKEPPPLPLLAEWPALPVVSVLVAAWNEADFIERHIESFLSLRYPHKELVLCAGGSDGTYTLARQYEGATVKVLEQQPGEGKQRALARSFRYSRGQIVFLTDADCLLDDDAVERTLHPVACGEELVCTGGSRPFPELLTDRFVLVQAASDYYMYSDNSAGAYLPGLLGRNCALRSTLLQQTHALSAPAPTGTDYVLAKILDRANVSIRQVRESQIQTRFPDNPKDYLRQQRRWLRNVAWFGWQFRAWSDLRASIQTSFLGVTMLSLPIFVLWAGVAPLVLWIAMLEHGYLSRLRYLWFLRMKVNMKVPWQQYSVQFASMFCDFLAWGLTLIDYFGAQRRKTW